MFIVLLILNLPLKFKSSIELLVINLQHDYGKLLNLMNSKRTVADPGHVVRGRFICFTFSVTTSGNS